MGIQKKNGRYLSRETLLWTLILFSGVFFFVCIKCIPTANTDGTALLRATSMILSLCMPALLYAKVEEKNGGSDGLPKPNLRRTLLFAVCAFFFGAFAATIAVDALQAPPIFASFLLPTEISVMSLLSLLVFAFASVIFPYGLFASFAIGEGYFSCLFPLCCLYAALFFQSTSAPLLLIFGLVLALLRLQSGAFFPVLLANSLFLFGGYGVAVGLFSFDRFGALPMWAFLLITGVAFLVSLAFAIDFRAIRVVYGMRKRAPKHFFMRFILISVAFLLVSILFATVFAI